MKRERDADTDYEADRWIVVWGLRYDRMMVRVVQHIVLQCVAVSCSVLQCDAVWCSVLQCVAV